MEVSGKVFAGRKQNPQLYCVPCDKDGLKESAQGYCQHCQEHLCKSCFEHHRKSKPSRNHVLLDKDNMPPQPSAVDIDNTTDNCTKHSDKLLEFYCDSHKTVACYVCVTLKHKQCKVDYIPDVSGKVSVELEHLTSKMDMLVKKCKSNISSAKAAIKQIDRSHRKVIEDIKHFRKDLNLRLDQMESELIKEADSFANMAKQNLMGVKVTCKEIAEEVKLSQSFLIALNEENKHNKLFTELKNAESCMTTWFEKEDQTVKNNQMYDSIEFIRNEKILDHLMTEGKLGKVETNNQTSETIALSVQYEKSLNVTFPSDKSDCDVSGIEIISATQMIVADYGNRKLKMIDIDTGTLLSEITLSSAPENIKKIPGYKLAVVFRDERCIQIVSYIETNFVLDRRINVRERCYSVEYCQDKLVVGCNYDKGKLVVMDLDGNVIHVFEEPGMFRGPEQIVISNDEKFIYVCDVFLENYCLKVDWQGHVQQRFEDPEFKIYKGIQELEDGTLLICCRESHTIIRLSNNFKKCEMLGFEKGNLLYPQNLAYSKQDRKLFISCSSEEWRRITNDTVNVFRVGWNVQP